MLSGCRAYLCLRRGDVRVTEYLAYCLNRHTVFQGQYCKRVPTNVVRDSFLDATRPRSHFIDALVDGVRSDIEQVTSFLNKPHLSNNLHQVHPSA